MGQILKKEQELMDELIDITKIIGEIYRRLYFEHSTNGNNTLEYNKLVEQLKRSLKEENQLYKELEITPDKTGDLIDYLTVGERVDIEQGNNVLHSIYKNDYHDLYQYRIISTLVATTFKDKYKYLQWLLDEGSFMTESSAEGYFMLKTFERTIDSDFDRNFMYQLNEKLNNCDNEQEQDRLAKIKYNLLFISKDIEDYFMDNTNIQDGIYYTFPFVGEYIGIAPEYCEDIQIEKGSAYVSHAMRGIFIKDDLVDENIEIDFEIFKIYMRSGLGLIYEVKNHDELIELLKDEILETNEETNYRLSISTEVLLDELDSLNKEKTKCKYIHFALKK